MLVRVRRPRRRVLARRRLLPPGRLVAAALGGRRAGAGSTTPRSRASTWSAATATNWERPLRRSRAGRELVRLGFADDVAAAARLDAYPGAPHLPRAPRDRRGGSGMSAATMPAADGSRTAPPRRADRARGRSVPRSHAAAGPDHRPGRRVHRPRALAAAGRRRARHSAPRDRPRAGRLRPARRARHEAVGDPDRRAQRAGALRRRRADPRDARPSSTCDVGQRGLAARTVGLVPGFLAETISGKIGVAGAVLLGFLALSALTLATFAWHPLQRLEAGDGRRPGSPAERDVEARPQRSTGDGTRRRRAEAPRAGPRGGR